MTTIKILYYKSSAIEKYPNILLGKVKLEHISETHVDVYELNMVGFHDDDYYLDWLFEEFGGLVNPLFKKLSFIEENQLHTSMSTGDVIILESNNKKRVYVCRSIGWKEIY